MNRLLVVGWDAADWKVIDPLLAKGDMPHLAGLLSQGVRANLATIHPPLSPMLWTSIATGKRPHKHGILGFTEPTPDGLAVRPISNLGRKTKALWNIAHQNGKHSVVVGWWPSHPAEPIRGAMVSDLFPLKTEHAPNAAMPKGAVSPAALSARMAELRVHPTEVDAAILNFFAPGWESVDQDKDKSVHDLASIIAETMSIHAAATELMETEPWDLAAVYYSGIDHFSHRFMRYHAGKAVRQQEASRAIFAGVVQNGYRYHDVMLGRLLALAGPDCAVMLMSDHGFHSDKLLPDYIPAEAAGPAVEHRSFGIFCMRAPGVPAGTRVFGASILDVTPTALHVMGLPAGMDMDGKVLVNAFQDGRPVQKIESWDAVEGEDGRHPPGEQYDAASAAEALKQLVDLGYVAPQGKDSRRSVEECVDEQRYNLARALSDAGRPDLSEPLLRELIANAPEQARLYSTLASCLLQMGDLPACRQLLEDFDRACADFAPRAAEELKRRRAEKPDKDIGPGKGPDRREAFERRELAEKAGGFVEHRLLLHCRLALSLRRAPRQKERARKLLEDLAKARRQPPALHLFLAQGFNALRDFERALEQVRRVRRADHDNWEALGLEARIHFQQKHYEEAVNRAVESLSLVYFQPWLHHLLAVSLVRLGEPEKAENAFRAALFQAPEFAGAHEGLGRLISRNRARIGEGSLHIAQAATFRQSAKEARAARRSKVVAAAEPAEPVSGLTAFDRSEVAPPADRSRVVTVVAGLPRSGTSMMMQMLAAGGIEPFTDEKRLPDEDNPRGYLEHQGAARLHRDASWLPEARGKAVKIVAHLLPYLPKNEQYRVIFLHRNPMEVVASQRAMLDRLGRKGGRLSDQRLIRTFIEQLVRVQAWLQKRPDIAVLAVQYADAVRDPAATAARVARFVGPPFNESAAQAGIEPSLRHQMAGPGPPAR
jgi:predicted AlkP superfamily phosphohydrolase/phosphomutase/Flp pilus assembly protein TadD